jgi:regulator of sirC expression with transglutaminase-like and TPR domain
VTGASRRRFAEVVRAEPVDLGLACLLVGAEVEPDLDVDASLSALDVLAAAVRRQVAPGTPPRDAAAAMAAVLGEQAGFGGRPEDYDDVRSSLLHEVLRRGRGLPLLLSVLWAEVAARAGVVASPVALPGHVVVAVGEILDEHVLVDPFSGGRLLAPGDVEALAPGAGVPTAADPVDLLLRLLTNVRALTTRQDRTLETARTRLWAVELSLLLPRHPVGLRQEHGQLLVRLGDHLGGAAELELYADVVEDADGDAAEQARRQARLARARLN